MKNEWILSIVFLFCIFLGSSLPAQQPAMEIEGKVKVGDDSSLDKKGMIRWNEELCDLEGYDGTNWYSLTGKHTAKVSKIGKSSGAIPAYNMNADGISISDSSAIIYDSGGPNGDYSANEDYTWTISIPTTDVIGIYFVIDSLRTETNFDSLILGDQHIFATSSTIYNQELLVTGLAPNGSGGLELDIRFRSGGLFHRFGFAMRYDIVYGASNEPNSDPSPMLTKWTQNQQRNATFGGLQFGDAWDIQNLGQNSIQYGWNTLADGDNTVAFGRGQASGDNAVAIGQGQASGDNAVALGQGVANDDNAVAWGTSRALARGSIALGERAFASGDYAIALGDRDSAVGNRSLAFGLATKAAGAQSIALGAFAKALGDYSIAIGERAVTGILHSDAVALGLQATSTTSNQFAARFTNGYRFETGNSTRVEVAPGGNAWTSICDRRIKENFLLLDGDQVLQKIAAIPFGSWNYIGQDPGTQRHYGIMAQDFYKAFGQDAYGSIGNDTRVNPIDLLGVAYSAIKALNEKVTALEKQNQVLAQSLKHLAK